MNWSAFSEAKERMVPKRYPVLIMAGVAFDNGTKCSTKQTFLEHDNDYHSLFVNFAGWGRDFVWTGTKVRTGSGHPFLAGFDSVFCAGRVEEDHFFFHSGHYHPKRVNALIYFSDFVVNSCRLLSGANRDLLVDRLCKIPWRLYPEYSESDVYDTSFEMEARPRVQTTAAPSRLKIEASGRTATPAMQIKGKGNPVPTIRQSPQRRSVALESKFRKSVPALLEHPSARKRSEGKEAANSYP